MNSIDSLRNVLPTNEGVPIMRKTPLLAILIVGLLFGLSNSSLATADSTSSNDDEIIRIVMLPPEAEATGMFVDENGNFFVNAMHPDIDNYKATVGVINGVDWNNLPEHVPALASTSSATEVWHGIRTGYGYYQVLLQSGDILSDGNQAGGIYAADDGQELLISQKPDYNAFVPLNEEGTQGYVYTAWEDRPAGISQIQINWNSTTSEWDVLNSQMLNLSDINGAWVLCFGSMSPWGTPLFSEELYFDDTEEWNDDSFRYHSDQLLLADYLGVYPNPYDYGYIVEMGEPESTNPDLIRQLTMGRFSHENAMVMPDNKTVYLTDDGYDTVLFKYIAKRSGDLSEGTLYAAKLDQDSTRDSTTTGFGVEWIKLGTSSNAEVQSWIDEYDGITPSDYIEGENSYITDREINDWAEGKLNQDLNNDGTVGYALDDRVAFLESRKAAAALDASDEWNKMEGVAFNPNVPDKLYLAMSNIDRAMTDGQGDIDLTANYCGIVYSMTMNQGWNVNRIDPAIIGGPYTSSAQYECNIDNLAGPDNILVLDDGSVLVGEDTRKHENNMVWLWRESKAVTPLGNEELFVNSLEPVATPEALNSSWTYDYQAKVEGLVQDTTYTGIVVAKNVTSGEWNGIWWWNDIQTNGETYDLRFSLNRGCYILETTLYEKDNLNQNPSDATVLAQSSEEFVVGDGTCENGVYNESAFIDSGNDENKDNPKDSDTESIPGFGFSLMFIGVIAAVLSTRMTQ